MNWNWRSDKTPDRHWPVGELVKLYQDTHPHLTPAQLEARAQELADFQKADVNHRRYDDRKFKKNTHLMGSEMHTGTDEDEAAP